MNNVKKLFSKTSETFRNLIKQFPVTLAIIFLITIFWTIDIEQNVKFFDEIFLFCIITAVGTFCTEVFSYKKKVSKVIGYILSTIMALSFTMVIEGTFLNQFENDAKRILLGYLMILFCISIYKIIKDNNISFEEYILKIFANMFNTGITYAILNLGLTLIAVIFTELILSGSLVKILVRIQILLLGLFFVPALLNSIYNVKEKEVGTFFKRLIKFVLLPLVIISILIIYAYIIKILILRKMPSNVIFRILAGIFVVAFPIWNMAKNFKQESKLIKKVTHILPYLYMPFILLEVYSIYTRVAEFGVTPIRYFGIMFIIMQIIVLILTVIKKGKELSQSFIYMTVLIMIAFILPLNYNRVSYLSQNSILKKEFPENTNFAELSKESKTKISGAYEYLKSHNADKYIPENVKKQYELENEKETYGEIVNNTENIYIKADDKQIDIQEYSKMQKKSGTGTSEKLKFYLENEVITVNISELIKKAIDSKDAEKYIGENRLVKIDDTKDIYIIELYCSYDAVTKKEEYTWVEGYILYK